MKTLLPSLVVILATSVVYVHGDNGEAVGLGLAPVNPLDSSRGQQAPLKSIDGSSAINSATTRERKKVIVAVPHNHAEEFTLEKLCNDPFHSFLCKTTAPRKRRIDGNLRPGASLPKGFSKSHIFQGSAVLSGNLEAANSDANVAQIGYTYQRPEGQSISPEQSALQNVFTQQDNRSKLMVDTPSNEYLPSFGSPKPLATYNVPFALPLEPSSSSIRTPTTVTQSVTTTQRIPTTTLKQKSAFSSSLKGFPNNKVLNTNLMVTSTPGYIYTRPTVKSQFGFGYNYKTPSSTVNSPSASNQVVSAVSSGNEYLPPKDSLSPRPSDNVQFQVPFDESEDIKSAPQNIVPSRTGSGVMSTGIDTTPKPVKKERTHTLEELCKEAFHSFLCKPIDKPRRRIDGNIRPGANIPPHVLLSSGSNAQNVKQLPPNQSGGAVSDTSLGAGYKYEKPSGQPFQTTNLSPQYAPRPNFAQPLYTYQQALLNSSPSNSQPAIVAATTTTTHSHSSNPSVPCTCSSQQTSGGLEPAAQNLAPNLVTGYNYNKPSTPFTLPATSTTSRPAGYNYPKPSGQAFTLPPRPSTEAPVQRGQQSIADSIENNALPPSSQFEILKL